MRHHTLNCDVCHTLNDTAWRQDASTVNVNEKKCSVIPDSNQLEYLKKICGLSVPPTESPWEITPLSYLWTCAPLVDLMSLDAFGRLSMYITL
jgi:hypothetical protein